MDQAHPTTVSRRGGRAGLLVWSWAALAALGGGCSGDGGGALLDAVTAGRVDVTDVVVGVADGGDADTVVDETIASDSAEPAPVDPVVDGTIASDSAEPGDLDAVTDADVGGEPSWGCERLPVSCDGAEPATTEHHLVTAAPCSFGLVPWDAAKRTERDALIDALVDRSGGRIALADVLGHLNREGRAGITTKNAVRLRNHDWRGFRWNSGDDGVDYWYPQGITGSSDAFTGGRLAGRNVVMVSWYHRSDDRPTKGVRVSLADVSDLNDVRYRHLLLVEPTGTVAAPDVRSVQTGSGGALHAGGIVWWGELLYVADTTGGFRVFDLSRVMRATDSDDTSRIGVMDGRFDALGYSYAVPELTRFQLAPGGCPLRFSFVGLDRSSEPPALVSGEYRRDDVGGRIVAWALDGATGLLEVREGEVRAAAAFVSGQTRMQGALRYEGNVYVSSSSQYQEYGRLYRTREGLGESRITAWVYGAEDLYMERDADVVWTAAEFPGSRDVVGIPLPRP